MRFGSRILAIGLTLAAIGATAAVPVSAESPSRQPCSWRVQPGFVLACHSFAYRPDGQQDVWSEYQALFAAVRKMMREINPRVDVRPARDDARATVRQEVERLVEKEVESLHRVAAKPQQAPAIEQEQAPRTKCSTEHKQLGQMLQTLVQCVDRHNTTISSNGSSVDNHSQTIVSITTSTSSNQLPAPQ